MANRKTRKTYDEGTCIVCGRLYPLPDDDELDNGKCIECLTDELEELADDDDE